MESFEYDDFWDFRKQFRKETQVFVLENPISDGMVTPEDGQPVDDSLQSVRFPDVQDFQVLS